MKRIILITYLVSFFSQAIQSQSFAGFSYENYSGLNGLMHNPATIAATPIIFDLNIIGADIFVNNDFLSINSKDIIKSSGLNIDQLLATQTNFESSSSNNLYENFETLGPSLMFRLNDRMSVGLFTKLRFITNVSGIDVATYERYKNHEFNENNDYSLGIEKSSISVHAWAEMGASYAMSFALSDQTKLKVGANIKRLQGIANAFISLDKVKLQYHADTQDIDTTGDLAYGISIDESKDYNNIENVLNLFDKDAKSIGFDFGAVYEWSPISNENEKTIQFYKYRFGISITDLGNITYSKGQQTNYNLSKTGLTEEDLDGENLQETLTNLFAGQTSKNALKAGMPTAMHLNIDWSINNYFYLNLNSDIGLRSKYKNTSKIVSNYTLTPRFESKFASLHIPINIDAYSNFGMGIGLRLGPLYIGSNTAISSILGSTQKADFYFGLRIPLHKKTKKQIRKKAERAKRRAARKAKK